jgi:deoxyribonuclease (pyrimidine dimer)
MTRINLVDPSTLHRKHLVAELHELPRVFSLARKAQHVLRKKKIPQEYVLGTGHVTFFYDKLGFLLNRYDLLCQEMRNRKYNCNQIPKEELIKDIPSFMVRDYEPTDAAIKANANRIQERMPK